MAGRLYGCLLRLFNDRNPFAGVDCMPICNAHGIKNVSNLQANLYVPLFEVQLLNLAR